MKKIFAFLLCLSLLLPALGYPGFPSGGLGTGNIIAVGQINQASLSNPIPTTTSIDSANLPIGNPAFTLTVNGTKFIPTSMVKWAGTSKTTTYVGPTQLTAAIDAADVAAAGTAAVTVFSPAPGGGTSNEQTFTIGPYIYVGADCVLYHAYWGGTVTDHSIHGNNGTVHGTGSIFVPTGLQFPGHAAPSPDYVFVPENSSLFMGLGDQTVELWLNMSDDLVSAGIIAGGPYTGGHGWTMYRSGPNLVLDLANAKYSAQSLISDILGGWHHVVKAIKRDTGLYYYLDGTQPDTSAGNPGGNLDQATSYDLTSPLIVGCDLVGEGGMKGIIGEVRIWNRALSLAEATAKFNATKSRYGY
jgi:hypothetical protein